MKFFYITLITLIFTNIAIAADTPKYTHIGELEKIRTSYEDTLVHIARANNLGFVEIRAANPELDPWIPGEGAKVILPKMHLIPDAPQVGVLINLPEMRLYYFPEGKNEDPITYPIGIGREGLQTPLGETKITRKKAGPTWRPTARMREEDPELPAVVEAGPENPLGTHALYLGWPQYLIHGTNKPYGIGRRVSSGCIRMYPEGIKDIYPRIDVGTAVRVVDQPLKAAWIDNKLYLEAHPTVDDTREIERQGKILDYVVSDKDIQYITDIAGDSAEDLDWKNIKDLIQERNGYPVEIAKRKANKTAGIFIPDNAATVENEDSDNIDDIDKKSEENEKDTFEAQKADKLHLDAH